MSEKSNDDPPPSYESYLNFGFVSSHDESFDLTPYPSLVRPNFQTVPFLSEEEAKEAFAKLLSEHCCYVTAPVKELKFTLLQSLNCYRYVLQTFVEKRYVFPYREPYRGQPIYINGRPPEPWEIPVEPPSVLFKNQSRRIEIPNTSNVKTCSDCSGSGEIQCKTCYGGGTNKCNSCGGSGSITETRIVYDDTDQSSVIYHQETCSNCSGSGYEGCRTCNRRGRIECDTCRGYRKLRYYNQLTVFFENNKDDFLKKFEEIPDDLIRDCQGQNIYTEQNRRVYPINHHSEADINKASYDLINAHESKFSESLILAQRQDIYTIPVTNCHYTWKEKSYLFQVYGLDKKVYAPDFPRKCCCCTIL